MSFWDFIGIFFVGLIIFTAVYEFFRFYRIQPKQKYRDLEIRILTQNIRFDNVEHPSAGERSWADRKVSLINSLDFNTRGENSIICLQEVLHHQLIDILAGLNNNNPPDRQFAYYGIGRDDGDLAGEFAPILYRRCEWSIQQTKTYWLSDTPSIPSKGWDGALPRIVTILVLKSTINPLITIRIFNTHFDHHGTLARINSSKFIVDKFLSSPNTSYDTSYNNSDNNSNNDNIDYNEYYDFSNVPSFLCGDLNSEPNDEPYQILVDSGLKDSQQLVNKNFAYGYKTTFTGFTKHDDNPDQSRTIDYIWSSPASRKFLQDTWPAYQIYLRQFAIPTNYLNGFRFSDHRPVIATYYINKNSLFQSSKSKHSRN